MKVAIYTRVSTHYQIDKDSLPLQRNELINYSKYVLGIDEYEVFEDAGYSGKDTARPAYQDMMARIRAGEFTHLLVWKIDRISRNLLDFTKMYEELKKYNITFVSKNEQFDTSSAMGEAMLKIILVFAELERKLTSERVSSIMLSRAEKGLWNGANIPLGYKWDKEKKFPVVDDAEAKTIKLIYDEYIEIESTTAIARYLNIQEIPTKRGGTWRNKTIADIIRNPFYKGTYRYNYRESGRGKKKAEKEWILIEDNHEPIITKEHWEKCNKIMDNNSMTHKTKDKKIHVHIFSQLATCDKCNTTFIASLDRSRKDGYKPSRYRCRGRNDSGCDANIVSDISLAPFIFNYIVNFINTQKSRPSNIDDLETYLLKGDLFKNVVGISKDDLETTYTALFTNETSVYSSKEDNSNINKINDSNTKRLKILRGQKEKLERAAERLHKLFLFSDESMSEKDYLIEKKELESQISKVNSEIQNFYNDTDILSNNDIEILKKASNFFVKNKLLYSDFIDVKKLITTVDKELVKDFVNTVIEKITILDGNITSITFKNGLKHNFIYKN